MACTAEQRPEVRRQRRRLRFMGRDRVPVHFQCPDLIPAQALAGVRMEKLGVGVAFPYSSPLAALLLVSSTFA